MEGSIGDIIIGWLEQAGLATQYAIWAKNLIIFLLIILMAIIVDKLTKRILLSVIGRFTRKTQTKWDDMLLDRKVFHRIAHLAPAVLIYYLIPIALESVPFWLALLQGATKVYIIIIVLLSIDSLLSAINDIYNTYEISKTKPIKGYIQVIKIILYSFGAIIIISILIGKSPFTLLAGLGALTAVIMLIFKDTILGLVGSVQLSANDMVNVGDWISMPDFKADGIVQEITLATVKVQNWDKTISTIPTYSMITSSFQNWRGMQESGGRRIMRSVKIDQNTIHFLTKEELEKFKRIQILGDFIEKKQQQLEAYNQKHNIDNTVLVNGRRQTNIGILRAYLMEYLKRHPKINEEMLILVRQLEPGETGLPLQIYCFSRDQAWADYEVVQADIFDHLLATLHEFELKVFQNPTGHDLRSLKK
ncbi:MAG: mechanosensitive ion channel family protein [Bacteroidota bacterium]